MKNAVGCLLREQERVLYQLIRQSAIGAETEIATAIILLYLF